MADETQTLREAIRAQIEATSGAAVDRARDHFVDLEINRRSDMIVRGVSLLRDAERELNKINRPDQEFFDGEGKVTASHHSKQRIDEIKKVRENRDRITAAIDEAIAKAEFQKLENILAKQGGGGDKKGDAK